jgi:hypothetical protein
MRVMGVITGSRRAKLCAIGIVVVLAAVLMTAHVAAFNIYSEGTTGVDVSWPKPNCSATPPTQAAFGIVGVTGGLVFTPNDCLLVEGSWFANRALYMNTGYPGTSLAIKYASYPRQCPHTDTNCLAYNFGFNAAEYALLYAASLNVHATTWWLDVETENSWSTKPQENQASIQGAIDAVRQEAIFATVGVYSTPLQWQKITGGWKNGLPNWVGTGGTKRDDAVAACNGSDFTGGGTVLAQYILDLDHDYVCGNAATQKSAGNGYPLIWLQR